MVMDDDAVARQVAAVQPILGTGFAVRRADPARTPSLLPVHRSRRKRQGPAGAVLKAGSNPDEDYQASREGRPGTRQRKGPTPSADKPADEKGAGMKDPFLAFIS
jgi:hypothetical protein